MSPQTTTGPTTWRGFCRLAFWVILWIIAMQVTFQYQSVRVLSAYNHQRYLAMIVDTVIFLIYLSAVIGFMGRIPNAWRNRNWHVTRTPR